VFAILSASCRKEQLKCTGNCSTIKFGGIIIDKASNTPLQNNKVEITVAKNGFCLFCKSYSFGNTQTGRDGTFSVVANFDTTLLKDNHFIVAVKPPNNYITYPEPVGPGLQSVALRSSFAFYENDPVKMENILFEFYPATVLTINLKRTTPLSPSPNIGLDFEFDNHSSSWGITESAARPDTSITIKTTANMYTKIKSYKQDASNVYTFRSDSVLCRPGISNSITITY
jgi:hypothetical protein